MFGNILGIVLLMFILVPGCTRETAEDKIKKVITSIQTAAGERKMLSVLEHLSKAYRDPQGNDYEGIKGLLTFYFFRHQAVHVYIPDMNIAVNGDSASASFEAVLTGRSAGGSTGSIIPEALGVYRFDVALKLDNEKWKVLSARWERVGDGAPAPAPGQ